MKNNLTILLMVLFIPVGVMAQSENFSFGVKAGVNVANQKYAEERNPIIDTKSLVGLHAGVFARYLFWKSLAARLELLYSQKGSKWEE